MRLTDHRTGEQRGCNSCWNSIQETLDEFTLAVNEDVPEIIEVVSLDEVTYDSERTDRETEDV